MNILQKAISKANQIANGHIIKEVLYPSFQSAIQSMTRYNLGNKQSGNMIAEYKNWVFACVNIRSEEVASIELSLIDNKSGETVENKELFDLLNDVNPNTTFYELVQSTQAFLDLTGNAFWWLARDGKDRTGKIRQIYMISPDKMTILTDKSNSIKLLGYEYSSGSDKIVFKPNEILHFKNFNPSGNYPSIHKGMGIVEGALWAINTDNESRNWNYSFFKNSAKPDGILTTETSITDAQFERLEKQWGQTYRGSSNNAKTAILENGLKWQDISKTQKDMDFIAQRTFGRDEILAMFRTPKSVIGITDDVNRANAEASDYVFARRTIKPLMRAFTTFLNEYLVPEYTKTAKLHFKDPVPEDRTATVNGYGVGFGKWLTRNDIRRKEGLEPSDNGDVFYGQAFDVQVDEVKQPKSSKSTSTIESKTSPSVDKAVDDFVAKLAPKQKEIKKTTAQQKSVYVDAYEKRFDKNEKALQKDVEKYFKDQEKEVLANLAEEFKGLKPAEYRFKSAKDVIFDKKKAVAGAISLITPHIREFLKDGAEIADSVTGHEFNPEDPAVAKFVQERSKYFAVTINDTTADALLEAIKRGTEDGLGYDEIRESIENVYVNAETYRTDMITRTEVSASLNQGSIESYKQAGIESLEWVTVNGGEAEECQANDGEVRKIGEAYSSGEEQPPNHPNCKCTVIAVFND